MKFSVSFSVDFFRAMIQSMIVEGRIVPSEITVKLLCKAMEESGNDKFLIDGFPRNEENRIVFENVVRVMFILLISLSIVFSLIPIRV